MTARQSTATRRPFSASNALEAVSRSLLEIKMEDRLTWADMGAVLGKSDDQAAKYADGSATMDFITFGRARKAWNGRFTRYFDRLCDPVAMVEADDQRGQTSILAAALALSVALEDGKVDPDEVRANRKTLENARDAIDAQLSKLRPLGETA